MESEAVLRLLRVSHVFHRGTPNEVTALDRVDLELARGSFTVVLGANGSGKSTLLGAVAGSLGTTPGKVFLDGRDVTRWPEQRRAALIGRVFQNP
ncbi:MAG: ATP-binding cassette domain-containing protein, partial [Gemmatimonadales bacterium]